MSHAYFSAPFLLHESCLNASSSIIRHTVMHRNSLRCNQAVFPKLQSSGEWQGSVPPMTTPEYLPLFTLEDDLPSSFPTDINLTGYLTVSRLEHALRRLQGERWRRCILWRCSQVQAPTYLSLCGSPWQLIFFLGNGIAFVLTVILNGNTVPAWRGPVLKIMRCSWLV